ncbi:D-alanyl-D-alanine carboxypeptidase family protein [Streptomyces sp. NPDC020412]|uniref:D-alanyl-D-alanine carboxypeptidase family protein n=1 Tax=Streptomyces sp. NPDC020412 TaxID=3365073 RepID=UPI0037AFDCA0
MAGESPEKSEQRKSSGEAGPGERDPRLALADRSDQATAVFTLPSDPDASDTPEESVKSKKAEEAEVAEGATEESERPEKSEKSEGSGEGDEPAAADADADDDDNGADGDADDAGDDEGEADDAGDVDGAGVDTATAVYRRTPVAIADDPTAETTAVIPEPPLSAAQKRQEAVDVPAPGSAPEAAPERRTAGSGPRSAGASKGEAESEAESGDGDGSVEDAEPTAQSGSTDTSTTVIRKETAEAARRTDTATTTLRKDGPSWAKGKSAPAKDAAATDAADADAKGESAAEAASKGDGGDGPVDQATAVFAAPRKAPIDSPTTALKLPPARSESYADKDAKDAKGAKKGAEAEAKEAAKKDGGEKDGDESAQDGATKAIAKPDVDPEAKPGAKAAKKASTFVPLRDTDEPKPTPKSTPKPAADASAPAAAASVATPAAAPADLPEAERTTQQPMPPRPPLDLLAELTNTPETPARAALRRVKIWTPLVLLLLIAFAVAQILRPLPEAKLELSGKPTFTIPGSKLTLPFPSDDGQGAVAVEGVGVIGTYGPQKPAPTASVGKVMTAYVILRDRPLKEGEDGPKITVDKQAEEESKRTDTESVAKMREGQEFTQKQMIQMMMIPSGNNAARLLARWDAGSEEAFLKKMNDAAKSLGMTNTNYTDPSGFKKTNTSTPLDQLKLAEAAMKNKVLVSITDSTSVDVPGSDKYRNGNDKALLKDGVDGIKTGSTTPAGGNLLWSFRTEIDGKLHRVNGITMNVQGADALYKKTEKAVDKSIEVITAARAGVDSTAVVKKGQVVGYLDNGFGTRAPVVATQELKAVGWAGLTIDLTLTGPADGELPNKGVAGEVVGEVSIGTGPGRTSAPVALQSDLAEPGFGDKLTRLG